MIRIENVEIYGIDAAMRGMRNPMNSWKKADTVNGKIGPNDMGLAKRLISGGTEHRKFLRQIMISMDITAPLYWWKEYDTYKVGTVANSCSTMHKIHAKPFELDDFSAEHLLKENATTELLDVEGNETDVLVNPINLLNITIGCLNNYRDRFLETKDKIWWWQMIQLLPSSYNQRRTVTLNYEVAMTIIRQRFGHKLDEWHTFVNALITLPYMEDFCG